VSAIPPLYFRWDGEYMVPLRPSAADRHYVIGQDYRLEVREERSVASHAHEFAWLTEAWKNLPEEVADLYPTPDHLRKRALIQAGYYDETIIDVGTNAGALRVASAIRAREEFSHVVVRGPLVAIRTAKSQSRRSMNKQEFQASKTALMEVVAAMIGVATDELVQTTAKAA
jgi:hypothetical protein